MTKTKNITIPNIGNAMLLLAGNGVYRYINAWIKAMSYIIYISYSKIKRNLKKNKIHQPTIFFKNRQVRYQSCSREVKGNNPKHISEIFLFADFQKLHKVRKI